MFGNGRRHRSDDRARLFMLAKLQRNRGTDYRLLPLMGRCQTANPVPPFFNRSVEHCFCGSRYILAETLIWAQEKMKRAFNAE